MGPDAVEEGVQRQDRFASSTHGQFVEHLHADHHDEREERDDDTRENCIDKGQKVGPPASKFEPAP